MPKGRQEVLYENLRCLQKRITRIWFYSTTAARQQSEQSKDDEAFLLDEMPGNF
jgi:hypothetical protein